MATAIALAVSTGAGLTVQDVTEAFSVYGLTWGRHSARYRRKPGIKLAPSEPVWTSGKALGW